MAKQEEVLRLRRLKLLRMEMEQQESEPDPAVQALEGLVGVTSEDENAESNREKE